MRSSIEHDRSMETAALGYATERGWPVFPLLAGDKAPLTAHGFKDATTDEAKILHWWDRWPDANIGIACGGNRGPVVLDIDDPKHPEAVAAIAKLRAAGVAEVATARGFHFYFASDPARRTTRVGYGEIRAAGGYVVSPPSLHPTGKQYVWTAESDGSLVEVPVLLLPDATSGGVGSGPQPPPRSAEGLVPEGQRHHHLVDRGRRLARGSITDEAEILAMLRGFNAAFCSPPTPDDEVIAIARDAAGSRIADRERTRARQRGASSSEYARVVLERRAGL